MPKLNGQELAKQTKARFIRLQENVEAGAPALIVFDLTLLFIESYVRMYGWKISKISVDKPEFISHKEDWDAVKAFNKM